MNAAGLKTGWRRMVNRAVLKVFFSKIHIEGLHPSGWYWELAQELSCGYALRGSRGAYESRRKATIAGMHNKNRWESYAR